MSEAPGAGSPAGELQFDRAEFATPAPAAACRACGQAIGDLYYDVNGQPFCQTCRGHLQHALEGGSKVGRLLRAALYGSLAGLAGAAIYYGVTKATNTNFGLISVLVGLMVGKAVKTGSDARGGWFYQALAMLITYTAIVLTYIPPLIEGIAAARDQQPAVARIRLATRPRHRRRPKPRPSPKPTCPARPARSVPSRLLPWAGLCSPWHFCLVWPSRCRFG